jgi:hypothetical protein
MEPWHDTFFALLIKLQRQQDLPFSQFLKLNKIIKNNKIEIV